jgi:hypothetical protein
VRGIKTSGPHHEEDGHAVRGVQIIARRGGAAGRHQRRGAGLWWQAKGDWHQAHRCCQDSHDDKGAWAHAYLHRVEGDERNSAGWYRRAGKTPSTAPLDQEWEEIARALLA